jgi:hypothetical protein
LIALANPRAFAQGSTGGSIGNDNKSLSGSREEPRAEPSRRKRSEPSQDAPRRAARSRDSGRSGGTSAFDGIWVVRAIGQSAVCAGLTSANVVKVSGGRISGNNVRSGSISANGALTATGGSGEMSNVTTGRLSGSSGGGTFRQANGCTGRWVASRQ